MRFVVLLLLLSAPILLAQGDRSDSAKIRAPESGDSQATVLGDIPSGVLDVQKAKGVVSKVDLAERTVSIRAKKQDHDLVLRFSQPEGREQIKTSKKAEKRLGKKRLRLDEVQAGAAVEVRYYPMLGQILDLTVDAE